MKPNKVLFSSDLFEDPLKQAFKVIPINQPHNSQKIITNEPNNIYPAKLRLVLKGKFRPENGLTNARNQKTISQLPLIEDKTYFNTQTQWLSKSSKSILKKQKTLNQNNNKIINKNQCHCKNVHFGSEVTPITQIIPIEPIKHPQLQQQDKQEDTKCQCAIF